MNLDEKIGRSLSKDYLNPDEELVKETKVRNRGRQETVVGIEDDIYRYRHNY